MLRLFLFVLRLLVLQSAECLTIEAPVPDKGGPVPDTVPDTGGPVPDTGIPVFLCLDIYNTHTNWHTLF